MQKLCLRMFTALFLLFVLASCGMILTSCGMENSSSHGQGQSYKDTKTMVLDVLNSTEGQKAIQSSAEKSLDPTMKLLTSGEGQQIQIAVKDILTTTDGDKILQKVMTNPKFAGQFAQAVQSSDQQIHKNLMKDPEYQKALIEVMNDPEFEKIIINVMKSAAFRKQMMNVIQESMQSPLFKMQLLDLMKTVVEEGVTPKTEEASSPEKTDGKKDAGGMNSNSKG